MMNDEISELKIALQSALEQIKILTAQIEQLTAQLAWFQRQLFGAKSEKFVPLPDDAPSLPGLESEAQSEPPDPQHIEAHDRKAREKFGWDEIPENLPREEVIIDVPEEEREGYGIDRLRDQRAAGAARNPVLCDRHQTGEICR